MMIDLNKLYIGVREDDCVTYFKDLTEATMYVSRLINNGKKVEIIYCDQYGCQIRI